MGKKILFVFLVAIISFQLVSSIQIETKGNFSLGENFIAKVSGNFYTPLTKSNIYFYRGQSETSFGIYSLKEINSDYYIYFKIPLEKIPDNYSLQIKGIKYYSGGELIENDTLKYFTILNKKALISISPAISFPQNYSYNLSLVNLDSKPIEVSYSLGRTAKKNISLKEGETKKITLQNSEENKFEKITFDVENESYSALVYSELNKTQIGNKTIETNKSVNKNTNETNNSKSNKNESKSLWEILFGKNKDKDTKNNKSVNKTKNKTKPSTENNVRTCKELNLSVCSNDEECSGKLVDGKNSQCCTGTCEAKKNHSSDLKTIGWIIIGVAVIFLIWFFKFKFSKTKRSSSKLIKTKK